MIINDNYWVNTRQRSKRTSVKNQILLCHTSCTIDDYFTMITTRYGGEYDKSFTYTIGLDGQIYQHFSPLHYSNLFNDPQIDPQIISIGLENVGQLIRKSIDEDFFDWKGAIYKGKVYGKLWRNHNTWAEYSVKQTESMLWLIKDIINVHHIESNFSGNNLPLLGVKKFNGVLTRSNYHKFYYDLSPAMDFEKINTYIKTECNG